MNNTAENLNQPEGYTHELGELNRVEAALAELRAKYGNVPDYATKAGYSEGKAAIKELTKYRTGTDKARLAITKPHREFIEQVNQYAKGLIGEVEQLEAPHRDAKKEVDEAEQRKKEERIAKLREKMDKEITSYLDTAVGLDSTGLADLIGAAEGIDTGDYYDITKDAEDEKARVVRELRAQHDQALQREQLAAEREQARADREALEREKAELEALKAQQAPTEPREPSEPASPADPAEPREVATAGGTAFGFDDMSPWDEALEDLLNIGIDVSAADAVLDAISNGDVRHVAFRQ